MGHLSHTVMREGPDKEKLEKIKRALKKYPNGLWIRELARKSDVSKSTVHRYIRAYLKDDVECILKVSKLIEIYRLKKK